MVNDVLHVLVGGLFVFNDLDMSLASNREVVNKFPLCVESVSDRTA